MELKFILVLLAPLSLIYLMFILKIASNKDWSCIFGKHRFKFSGEKHGMYIDEKNNLIGTKRNIYRCRCGKVKKLEHKDYIRVI